MESAKSSLCFCDTKYIKPVNLLQWMQKCLFVSGGVSTFHEILFFYSLFNGKFDVKNKLMIGEVCYKYPLKCIVQALEIVSKHIIY